MDFYETLTAAVKDFSERGYVNEAQLAYWMHQIEDAARRQMVPAHVVEAALTRSLRSVYEKLVDKEQILATHRGAERFTLQRVAPNLRAELQRRIMASHELVKLNREVAIETLRRRFSGWATSMPPGGSEAVAKNPVKSNIRKSLAQLPFQERRVAIDQSHKFAANLSNIMAVDGGAIALIWRSHWRQPGYNYRPDHKERDQKVYAIRGNWAQEKGLMRVGNAGYYDQVTAVGEEIFCRCYAIYLYNLRQLPAAMLTVKGRSELARLRVVA